jgi:hypothetical protein
MNQVLGDGDDALHVVCVRMTSHSSGRADFTVWTNKLVRLVSHKETSEDDAEPRGRERQKE